MIKLESITDIDKLPSVLDVKEVSSRLIELVAVIQNTDVSTLQGAEAINYLISYCSYSTEEISLDASNAVLNWVIETYDGSNNELVEWQMANIVNLSRASAVKFFKYRLTKNIKDFERKEMHNCLEELGLTT